MSEYHTRKFRSLVVETMIEDLKFGEMLLRFLELRSTIRREEIAIKPERFSEELKKLLGDGSKPIEETLLTNLYRRLNIEYRNESNQNFQRRIKEALGKFTQNNHNTKP